jgi:hypothetical protein
MPFQANPGVPSQEATGLAVANPVKKRTKQIFLVFVDYRTFRLGSLLSGARVGPSGN